MPWYGYEIKAFSLTAVMKSFLTEEEYEIVSLPLSSADKYKQNKQLPWPLVRK
jgi:hypothetical protein